jgi:hypothetical protein
MWILGYLCILASFDWSTFDNEVELNACLAVFEIVKGIGKWHLKKNVPKPVFLNLFLHAEPFWQVKMFAEPFWWTKNILRNPYSVKSA